MLRPELQNSLQPYLLHHLHFVLVGYMQHG